MRIIRSQQYTYSLQIILRFISLDSKAKALSFKKELDSHINDLNNMPFKFRQSIYFNNVNIRDMIFKGYTTVYKIDKEQDAIVIIGIKNTQETL